MTNGRTIPREIQKQLSDWGKLYRRWWVYHYALGISATVASITVASNPKLLHPIPNLLETLAWLVACLVALITFLTPSRRAKAYLGAWRTLHRERVRYTADPASPLQDLLDAAKKGEDLICQSDPI